MASSGAYASASAPGQEPFQAKQYASPGGVPPASGQGFRIGQPRAAVIVDAGIYDNYFKPEPLEVSPGTTVRWKNLGDHRHTVTSDNGLFKSAPLEHEGEFSFTFDKPGKYSYHCDVHPKEMRGTVVVK
jgi:plastocyanin